MYHSIRAISKYIVKIEYYRFLYNSNKEIKMGLTNFTSKCYYKKKITMGWKCSKPRLRISGDKIFEPKNI